MTRQDLIEAIRASADERVLVSSFDGLDRDEDGNLPSEPQEGWAYLDGDKIAIAWDDGVVIHEPFPLDDLELC